MQAGAALRIKVFDPERAALRVEDYAAALIELAQTAMGSAFGQRRLDQIQAKRARLNADIQTILDRQAVSWGVRVESVAIELVGSGV